MFDGNWHFDMPRYCCGSPAESDHREVWCGRRPVPNRSRDRYGSDPSQTQERVAKRYLPQCGTVTLSRTASDVKRIRQSVCECGIAPASQFHGMRHEGRSGWLDSMGHSQGNSSQAHLFTLVCA